jgi:hemerythrin-like domain-containing protein
MHIEKENKVLFPMADVHLTLEVQQGLARDFEKLELEEIGAGKHEEFHQLLHELKGVYLQR